MKKINPIWIIALILLLLVFFKPKPLQSVIEDQKAALKQEYITYWADATDDNFCVNSGNCYPSCTTPKFQLSAGGSGSGSVCVGTTDSTHIYLYKSSMETFKDFKGQEVVVMVENDGYGYTRFGDFAKEGNNRLTTYYFVPYTLESGKFDVYVDGISPPNKIRTGVSSFNGRYKLESNAGGGNAVYYIGYKAQYACDLSPDEVWVQETFVSPFSIKDLAFSPTKFCKTTRPFVLRDLQQGETAIYPDPIPTFNKGNILTPPQDQLIVVNYATYYVTGVTNRCDVNQANIKVNGQWVCKDVIKSVEFVTVPYPSIWDILANLWNTLLSLVKSLFGG